MPGSLHEVLLLEPFQLFHRGPPMQKLVPTTLIDVAKPSLQIPLLRLIDFLFGFAYHVLNANRELVRMSGSILVM